MELQDSVFAYDAFVKNNLSVTTAQRIFGWFHVLVMYPGYQGHQICPAVTLS